MTVVCRPSGTIGAMQSCYAIQETTTPVRSGVAA
jgi:hypothetical protein